MLSSRREALAVAVACPKCGHRQPEPRTAYSTLCKRCGEYYRVQEALCPASNPTPAGVALRQVRCLNCGAALEAPVAASSTMCKHCSCHLDLNDYRIDKTVSRSFRTQGQITVEEAGCLLNTDSLVSQAVLKGRVIGRLIVQNTLEIHSSASIKGSFVAGQLRIPRGHDFRWPEPLRLQDADIAGELAASIVASGIVRVHASGRLFGTVAAAGLAIEAGAVFVGTAEIRPVSI